MQQSSVPDGDQNEARWAETLVILLIVAGFILTAFFGVRVLRSAAQLHQIRDRRVLQPGVTDVNLIRGWMTIPYIARAYRVPEQDLWQGLGIPEQSNRHKSLHALDLEYARGQPGAIINQVKTIISEYQSQHPTTPTPPGFPAPESHARGLWVI